MDCEVGQGISKVTIWTGLLEVLGLWGVVEVFVVLQGLCRSRWVFGMILFASLRTYGESKKPPWVVVRFELRSLGLI